MNPQKIDIHQRIVIKNGGNIKPGQKVVIKACQRNSLFEKKEKSLGSGVVIAIGDSVDITTKKLGRIHSNAGRKKKIGSKDLIYRVNHVSGTSPDAIITVHPIDE